MKNKPNLTFDEATHAYHADGVQLTSVSALLGVLTKQSLKNTTNERIKEKARVNSEAAIEKGKNFHRQAAEYLRSGQISTGHLEDVEIAAYNSKLIHYVEFICDFIRRRYTDKTNGRYIEYPICDPDNGLAGTPDLVEFRGVQREHIVIIDYKTNAQFDPNPFGKFMEPPLDSLPDTSMAGYIMQMNLYAHLVSVWYGVLIESISAHIVHVSGPHAPVIYENCITPESRALTVKLLEWKKNNTDFINNAIKQ